ncbi:MAG: hypothetical protein HKN43_01235 [Rhodothermales bacterium]|nr:hypothetical protein [Rhodothermales bacterium]
MSRNIFSATLIVAALFSTMTVDAQTLGRVESTESSAPDYYYFVQPGERTIQIHVIGSVKNSGLFEVGSETTLGQILAISGGPMMGPRSSRNKRKVQVRVLRASGLVYAVDLEDDETPYVDFAGLQEGDIVRVDVVEKTTFGWRDGLQIVTAAVSIALIYDRIQNN